MPPGDSAVPRLPGKFVWADLVTDNLESTRKFYGKLFGWSFQRHGDYLLAFNRGLPVAGMFQRQRPANQPHATPRWFGYISVNDIDHAQRAALRGGGRLIAAPFDVPDRGRQAVFVDPEGALFGIIRTSAGDPGDVPATPGGWVWLQYLSRDAHRAATFYQSVGGYQIVRDSGPYRTSDFILRSGDHSRATVRNLSGVNPAVRPTWLPFLRVTRLADTIGQATRFGGMIVVTPRQNLLNGKAAVIADPTGAPVGLIEWTN
ncbi:MAG: VOC family protein [Verrucomicrobia bacterium]|nr:VOC family protein [Verrucomicrobiota bacterium]